MDDWLFRISPCLRIVGEASIRAGWVEAARVIYEHELVLFDQSDYVVEIESERIPCPSGSFIIVPPGRRHVSREVSGRGGHRSWIHFDWIHLGDASDTPVMTYAPARPRETLFRKAPDFVPDQILRGRVQGMRGIRELFTRIDQRFNHGDGRDRMVARGLFLELLLELLCSETEPRRVEDANARLASKIRFQLARLADTPPREASSIQARLEESGLSYAHQFRVFRRSYGISPLRYVAELRMVRIKNLLRDTDLPVSVVADKTGFDNLGYFSRMFKKHAGMSPREYRLSATMRGG